MEGIGKLIELLNEYKEEKNIFNTDMDGQLEIGNYRYVNYPCAERLCSKKYGFIKWLVDNDKININEYREEYSENNLYCNSDFFKLLEYYDVYESLLMLLAIQDSPIEFLCSILK